MPKLDTAKSVADAYLDEIDATIEIRQSYSNIVVGMAGQIMEALRNDGAARSTVQKALKHKSTDPSALYKPLVVQVNGVFENYIRSLAKAVIEDRFETVELYTELRKEFRDDHIAHAARVLTYVKAGSVMGVPYNFDDLLANLGKGLSGQKGYKLNPEVYTKLMGNCTADRLEKLFAALALPVPFSEPLGRNAELKAYFADRAKGRVADRAKEQLDKKIQLRNDIVHGDLTRTVDLNELQDTLKFFRALMAGLDELIRA